MNLLSAPMLTGAAVVAGTATLWLVVHELFLRYRSDVHARLADEFGDGQQRSARTVLFKDLSRLANEVESANGGLWVRWELIVEQAAVAYSLRQMLLASIIAGLVPAIAVVLTWKSAPSAVVTLLTCMTLPALYTLWRRAQRIETLRRQLPDAFDIMSRSIRAGQTVMRAFQVVADDFDPPLGEEFAWCYEQQKLGLPLDVALRDLARRTGVPELQMLIVALLVQRQSGGSPVELLENLALVVRKRNKLREKVKALTAEGRMQAMVLLCIPPVVLAAVSFTNPDYIAPLWTQRWLLAAMAFSELLGALWIRKIISFRY
ncbi:MAG: type II secretion system F family protein [Planctomycetaceae bacterium]